MYYIGIDISKFKHDCVVIDDSEKIVAPSTSFTNDSKGFSQLKTLLYSLGAETRIGVESTGHYGENLKTFLKLNNFSFMEIPPPKVYSFGKSRSLRKTKSDSIDCMMIASYLTTVKYKPYQAPLYPAEKLKSLTRFRDSLVRLRSRQLVELTNLLDKVFPEFKPFFKGRFSATALYILSNYLSPEKISNMNSKSYDSLRKVSRGKFSTVDFAELKLLAKNTVGNTEDYLLQEIRIVLDLYYQLESKIDEIDSSIKECVLDINPPILTVPGIGFGSAAVIIAEFGDFSKFDNASQLLSFAGLEPGYFQSGTSEKNGRMVKHGSSYLRYRLMNCAQTVVNHEPTFAIFFKKKRAEGKPYRVALSHVVKKLLRVIFTLQTKNLTYDADLVK